MEQKGGNGAWARNQAQGSGADDAGTMLPKNTSECSNKHFQTAFRTDENILASFFREEKAFDIRGAVGKGDIFRMTGAGRKGNDQPPTGQEDSG